ncbi:MAG: fibronectin type III domain-containing protein, partial [bacterium]
MLNFHNSTRFHIQIFRLKVIFLIILIFSLFIIPQNVHSVIFELDWDFPEELQSQIIGYRVFFRKKGEDYNIENNVQEFSALYDTNCSITLPGDDPNYCFSITAFYGPGNESPKSNEDCYDPNSLFLLPPVDDTIMDCTIYEDAEDGYTTGWIIYDKDPSGASISNVYDNDRQSRVIELSRVYRDYNYLLQKSDGSKWNNSSQFIAKWSMKYSMYFIIYFNVTTTTGDKSLFYTPDDFDALGLGNYIHNGLGSD